MTGLMQPLTLIVFLLPVLAGSELHHDGIQVRVEVVAQIYTWTVRNENAEPIMSFAIDTYNSYNHQAPEGWEVTAEDDHFRAWTNERHRAIQPHRSAEFSARVSSYGAVLGEEVLSLGTGGGDPTPIGKVWAPVGRPLSQYILIPGMIVLIALLHLLLLARSSRSRPREAPAS